MQDTPQEPFHLALRRARRAANVRQGELALKVGCTQSALSMFEGGKPAALARETVKKIAAELGVELPEGFDPGASSPQGAGFSAVQAPGLALQTGRPLAFCPDFQCLSNFPYSIGGQVLFLPTGAAGRGPRCAICGEILESACPACGAAVSVRGGCCPECGAALVAWPEGFADDAAAWISAQRTAVAALGLLPQGPRSGVRSGFSGIAEITA